MATSAAFIDLDEGAAPATPAAGKVRIYAKTDGSTYQKDDTGSESALPGSGGGTADLVRVSRSTTQTITTSTQTVIGFDTEAEDVGGYHDNATNNSRLTVPAGRAGVFTVGGCVFYDNNATGQRQLYLLKNGVAIGGSYSVQPGNSGFGIALLVAAGVRLADGDYVELATWQNSGGNRTIGNSPGAVMWLVRNGD